MWTSRAGEDLDGGQGCNHHFWGTNKLHLLTFRSLGPPETQEQQIVLAFEGVLGQELSQDGAGCSTNVHFSSHRESLWVIAPTRDPRLSQRATSASPASIGWLNLGEPECSGTALMPPRDTL